MNRIIYLLYTIFPLVYLDNGGYRGQTPPTMPDYSLTSGEIGFLVLLFLIAVITIIYKKNKKKK